jgi:hypothetical protein
MSEGPQREEIHQAVDRAVQDLLEGAGVVGQPPINAIALARHFGLVVSFEAAQAKQGRASRGMGRKQAVLRAEPTEERRQWASAHQIGVHFRDEVLRRLELDPEQPRTMSGESLANLFADHLLVPQRWLRAEAAGLGYDLLALKERFRTAGHELIAWRLLDLEEPCIITVIDNDHVERRRSNAWRINRALSEPERTCQGYVHHYSRPHALSAGGWSVQGWPIHAADWKREILRSVVDDGALEEADSGDEV